jgi:hypothetical protein
MNVLLAINNRTNERCCLTGIVGDGDMCFPIPSKCKMNLCDLPNIRIYVSKYTRISTVRHIANSVKLYHEEKYFTTLASSIKFPYVHTHLGSYIKLFIITFTEMYLIYLLKIDYSLITFDILILISELS